MKPNFIIGLVLVILGILVIAYDYYPPRRERHHIGVGPVSINATVTEEGSDPTPLIFGGLAIVGGLFLMLRRT